MSSSGRPDHAEVGAPPPPSSRSDEPRRWTLHHGQTRDDAHNTNPVVLSGPALAFGELVEVMLVSEHEAAKRAWAREDVASAEEWASMAERLRQGRRLRDAAQAVVDAPMEDHEDSVSYFAALDRMRAALAPVDQSDPATGDRTSSQTKRIADLEAALQLVAADRRPDGSWNRDREACRQIAAQALANRDEEKR